jgi:hypothetical protein
MAKRNNDETVDRSVIAEAILNMSYGHLLEFGEQLANVRQQRPETPDDFAKLLHSWAKAQ